MKTFEMLQELPKCNAKTESENMLLKNGTNKLTELRVSTNLPFVSNAIFVKLSKVEGNKMRCAYNQEAQMKQEEIWDNLVALSDSFFPRRTYTYGLAK